MNLYQSIRLCTVGSADGCCVGWPLGLFEGFDVGHNVGSVVGETSLERKHKLLFQRNQYTCINFI